MKVIRDVSLVQQMTERYADDVRLASVPRLDVVAEAPVEVFIISVGEVDLGGGAGHQKQGRDQVAWVVIDM